MSEGTILLIEDQDEIADLVRLYVEREGFTLVHARTGEAGLDMFTRRIPRAVLLDLGLPGIDGVEVARTIRERSDVPIIMLTARTSDEDIIQGLSLGADDYVAKPFSVSQLVLRVQAVLRRTQTCVDENLQFQLGDTVEVDCQNLCGRCGNDALSFTRREIEILQFLHANSTRPVSRDELLNKVWGYAKNLGLETRTVDIHIAKLRRKIEQNPAKPQHLITVRGAGYKLVTEKSVQAT